MSCSITTNVLLSDLLPLSCCVLKYTAFNLNVLPKSDLEVWAYLRRDFPVAKPARPTSR